MVNIQKWHTRVICSCGKHKRVRLPIWDWVEKCSYCGKKGSKLIKMMRWASHGKWLKPSTWFLGIWETK